MLSIWLRAVCCGDEPVPFRMCLHGALIMSLEDTRRHAFSHDSLPVQALGCRFFISSSIDGDVAHSFDFDWNSQISPTQCKAAITSTKAAKETVTKAQTHLAMFFIVSEQSAKCPTPTRTPAAGISAGSVPDGERGEGWNGFMLGSTSNAVRPMASSCALRDVRRKT